MRSRRTTYLLIFLCFAFIMTIIILSLSPRETEQPHLQKIIADIDYADESTPLTTTYTTITTDDDFGWITPLTAATNRSTRTLTTTDSSTTEVSKQHLKTDVTTLPVTKSTATTTESPTTTTLKMVSTTSETLIPASETPTTTTESSKTSTKAAKTTIETLTSTTDKPTTFTKTPKETTESSTTTTETLNSTAAHATKFTETLATTTKTSTTTTETSTSTTETPTTTTETTKTTKLTTTEITTLLTTQPSTATKITTKTSTTSWPLTTTTMKPRTTTTLKSTTPLEYHKMFEPYIVATGPCTTDDCKKIASKMLDSIDHSAHYCENFYQYSCGGVEDNPFLSPEDPKSIFDAIIKEELFKDDQKDISMFYESCIKSGNFPKMFENYLLQFSDAKSALSHGSVKSFLSLSSSELLNIFIKQNLPFFFDVSVELCDSKRYCPRLSLSFSASTKLEENFCLNQFASKMKSMKRSGEKMNLNEEYKNYHHCMIEPAVKARITNLKDTLDKLNTSLLHLTDDVPVILDDLHGFLSEYSKMIFEFDPTKVKMDITEEQNFELLTIENLEKDSHLNAFINWNTFLANLGLELKPHQQIRIYHKDKLLRMLKLLNKYESQHLLKDFLLILWVEHFIVTYEASDEAITDDCFEQTLQLMPLHVQLLLLKHLNSTTLKRIQDQIREIGKIAAEEISAALNDSSLEKITVELENADVQYLESKIINNNNKSNLETFKYQVTTVIKLNEIIRKYNFELMARTEIKPHDSIFLLKYRDSLHQLINNTLLIPTVSILDPAFLSDQEVPNYLKFAAVTNTITNSLLKQFNVSELNISGNAASAICMKREATGNQTLQNKYNMEASYKLVDQWIQRDFDALTLNWKILQRFGTSAGTSSMLDLSKSHESSLIWFEASPLPPARAYFIRKTQMECSATSDFQLLQTIRDCRMPARERVNLLLKYEPFFAQVFNCSQSSKMGQYNFTCPTAEESTEFPSPFSSTVDNYDYFDGFVEDN